MNKQSELKIKNAKLFDSYEKKFKTGGMTVKDGVIDEIYFGNNAPELDGAEDFCGAYVIPGLVDVHTHGRGGFDFVNACNTENKKINEILKLYIKAGTTSVMPALASAEFADMKKSAEVISALCGENGLIGVHFEGRYLNPVRRGAHNEKLLALPDLNEICDLFPSESMRSGHFGKNITECENIKMPIHITIAPELSGGDDFIKAALEAGATVGIGHSDASYEEAMHALSIGASSFTHLYNAMRPLHHRDPGTVGAGLLSNAYVEIICDGFHLHPAAVELVYRMKSPDKIVLITDSMEASGCPDGSYSIAGEKVIVKDGKALTMSGAIAGSTITLFDGLKNFMKFTCIPLENAINAATLNPARMIGADKIIGSLEKGKFADFLTVCRHENNADGKNEDIELMRVYSRGKKI